MRDDPTRRKDLETGNHDAVEMMIACDKSVCTTRLCKLDQVVDAGIGCHNPWWVDWVWQPDRLFLNAPAQLVDLIRRDVVAAGDPGIEKSLANFAHKLWAGDQLKCSVAPQIEEL